MDIKKKIIVFQDQNYRGLKEFYRGIEREALRILPSGELSQVAHPEGMGSALANPYITTDYSESQLEFVTPPFLKIEETLSFLNEIQLFAYSKLKDELIWPSSLPCFINPQKGIPVANYGNSNLGKLKTVYRVGLKNRYGDHMQAISGLHYNFSFDQDFWDVLFKLEGPEGPMKDFISKRYFSLMRNFHRYGWIILYFFGVSPILDKSFGGKTDHLLKFDEEGSLYLPNATSLRMSDLGYQNKEQKELDFCFNSLDSYIKQIDLALNKSNPLWQKIGVKVDGIYKQMNDKVLQIENEFYGYIRPKRYNRFKNKRPNTILKEDGVEYLEVRVMDINPYSPIGITYEQTKFLDIFLVYCLFKESPLCSLSEIHDYKTNWRVVAKQGREKGLPLIKGIEMIPLNKWSLEIYNEMKPIAQMLDEAQETDEHIRVLEKFQMAILDSTQTLSGHFIDELKRSNKSFLKFNLEKSFEYKESYLNSRLSEHRMEFFEDSVGKSFKKQKELEGKSKNFDRFLESYLED